jgi:1,4-alpha-glucan branching enzyme
VNNSDKLIAYHRWDQGGAGDDTIILLNFSSNMKTNYSLGFPEGGTWYVRFNSDANVYDGTFGDIGSITATAYSGWKDGMPYQGSVTIAPYSALILSQ